MLYRGGWSPDLFADIIHAGFHLLTYRKNTAGKDIPELPAEEFSVVSHAGDDGRPREYELAGSEAELAITKGGRKGKTVKLRQVTRRDNGRQVHILTSRQAGDPPAADVIYRMGSRWREENYFRYGRAHFALDALDSYAVTPEDPDRKVPSPARKKAAAAVKTAKKDLTAAEAARDAKLTSPAQSRPGQPAVVITNQMLAKLDVPVATARRKSCECALRGPKQLFGFDDGTAGRGAELSHGLRRSRAARAPGHLHRLSFALGLA